MAGSNNNINKSTSTCSSIEKEKKDSGNIKIKCKHRECQQEFFVKTFHIVPEVNNLVVDECITIEWKGNNPKPPAEVLLGTGKKISGPPFNIPTNFWYDSTVEPKIFPALYKSLTDTKKKGIEFTAALLSQIFTFNYEGSMVIHGMPWGDFNVRVLNPDQWKLTIELPIQKKASFKRGLKLDNELANAKAVEVTYNAESKDSTSITKRETTARSAEYGQGKYASHSIKTRSEIETSDSSLKIETSEGLAVNKNSGNFSYSNQAMASIENKPGLGKVVTLEKNSTLIDINGLKVIFFIADVIKLIRKLQEIADDIPKAGVYVDFEFAVFQGNLELSWGWKEFKKDYRAFYAVGAKVNITFLDIKVELGVGVSGFSVKFQVFVSAQGKIEVNGEAKNKEMESPPKEASQSSSTSNPKKSNELSIGNGLSIDIKAKLEGEIVGTVGARFEAFYFVKVEPKIDSGIKANGTLDFFTKNHIAEIYSEVVFTGIKAKLECSYGKSDALGTEKSVPRKKIEGNLGVDLQMKGKHDSTDGDKKARELMPSKTLWQKRFPDDLSSYKSDDEISVDHLRDSIIELLKGRYLNGGWFNSNKISIKRKKELFDDYTFYEKARNVLTDKEAYEEVDEDAAADVLLKKIVSNRFLDRSKKNIELLLLSVRKSLLILEKEKGFIEEPGFISFANKDLPAMLKNYEDPAKIFIESNK
jgi:hypothetical protein